MTTNRFDEQAMNIRRAEIEKKLDENRAKINTLRTQVYELIRKLDELGPGLERLHKTIIDSTTHTRPKTSDELYIFIPPPSLIATLFSIVLFLMLAFPLYI